MFTIYPKLNYLGKLLAKIEVLETDETPSLRDSHQEFIGLLSHELKTPLTSLRLSVQMVVKMLEAQAASSSKEGPAALLNLTQTADRQVDRLEALLDNFLDASVLKHSPLSVALQEVDLLEAITSEVEAFRQSQGRRHLDIDLKTDGPVRGHWDSRLIQRALRCLLMNAVTFGGEKPIEVSLEQQGRFVRIEVRDRGIGIALPDQRRIFGLFERGVSSANYGGIGVGLYLTRQIARAHQGDISVRSSLGEGSTFTIKLPLVKKHLQSVKVPDHAA